MDLRLNTKASMPSQQGQCLSPSKMTLDEGINRCAAQAFSLRSRILFIYDRLNNRAEVSNGASEQKNMPSLLDKPSDILDILTQAEAVLVEIENSLF